MNEANVVTAEELIVHGVEEVTVELSLPELDLVGGGGMGSLLL